MTQMKFFLKFFFISFFSARTVLHLVLISCDFSARVSLCRDWGQKLIEIILEVQAELTGSTT